ncbi:MAG: DUF6178 family protein [Myxococcota bacterium]|jgi:hypothetical protein|nr:DUF6178 family protein [Myxococcota bacterium]
MIDPLAERPDTRKILQLARSDKRAAEAQLAAMSRAEQVAFVCDAPLATRARVLELLDHPEQVIPLIPEAELCFTVKAVGLVDGSWILEHATDEQLVAVTDLDGWRGITPDADSMGSWLENYAEAGPETLLRAARAIDAEVWVLYLRERIGVEFKPNDDEGWQPPEGSTTLDGQVHFWALSKRDDAAAIGSLLQTLFQADYWLYFRIMQGVVWEMQSDLEEWASRWRTGRLEDLGFPSWDEAMRIYGFVRPDQRTEVPDEARALDAAGWDLPVWMPQLPAAHDARHAVFRAAAELDEDERRSFFYAVVSLANKLAVADGLPLGDMETLPKAIEKAASLASKGLEFIAEERAMKLADVVRRVSLERLFRVGANLDRAAAEKERLSYAEQLERALERFENATEGDASGEPESGSS